MHLWYQTHLIDVSPEQSRILTSEGLRRSDSEEFWNAVPHIDDAALIAALEEVEKKHVKKGNRNCTHCAVSGTCLYGLSLGLMLNYPQQKKDNNLGLSIATPESSPDFSVLSPLLKRKVMPSEEKHMVTAMTSPSSKLFASKLKGKSVVGTPPNARVRGLNEHWRKCLTITIVLGTNHFYQRYTGMRWDVIVVRTAWGRGEAMYENCVWKTHFDLY